MTKIGKLESLVSDQHEEILTLTGRVRDLASANKFFEDQNHNLLDLDDLRELDQSGQGSFLQAQKPRRDSVNKELDQQQPSVVDLSRHEVSICYRAQLNASAASHHGEWLVPSNLQRPQTPTNTLECDFDVLQLAGKLSQIIS